ncbi:MULTISPECIES: sigma-70 family RNA polymerase sigma factor [unclassified Erythrobacter]|jgi:RNA polymerase sigma factor (sigma-70 family)|uniref:sigma-70 family RNA polymerase sigma factor n=1 Tax=unclassified Erythrobacter TaxID=2633097 RepID=UPI00076D65B9|nr:MULTISPECIES: sigma-70 family RNA polymerase sigma factor [unclassified Erythrobacter]KWV95138.1 RNA polymerase subunit sigma-24 [Erythrobacter sp. AP23]MBO6527783.1 sigma-70 family RNA polymerase sigma factor [Erythrobacter sp.]MBO6531267.1 sigma-70 family RNA polymerase sigma factor [Erythrobacter sp.]MBO6766973.1 sigma-70 family RNA polymerase sigma factor [Erythrobacter sp.]
MIADEASLAQLMAASQKGDANAYRVLLSEIQLWLERYFRRRVAPAQLDDLVQEVMMAVHAKRATWDPTRAFLPWLAAIARYRWVDHLRKVYRKAEDELGDHDAAEDSEEEAVMARMSLERLFVHLPEKQSEVIELVKIEGLSIAEASAKTGQSESLVKVNIHRGLKKLSALVEKAD